MTWRDLEVAVRESGRRKTMHIVVERDGSLAVQVPKGCPEEKIRKVLESRAYDIFCLLEKWRESHRESVRRKFADGETFPLCGRNYPLRFVAGQEVPVKFERNEFHLRKGDPDPRESLRRFYREIARERILRRMRLLAPRFAAAPRRVQIRDMRTRWGSCTPGGTITYNWRCVLVPVAVMDYLIVHELTHLEHHRHSREFWNRVASVLPDYESSTRWLRRNGIKTEL